MSQNQNSLVQETLFSFLGEEAAPIVKESKAKNTTSSKKEAPVKPTPKPVEEKLELTVETIIRYGGENLPVTDYFSAAEISEGIRILEGDKAGEFRPIVAEDIRKRMEEEFAELIEGYTSMIYNKEKNLVIPVLQARKKGAHCYYCETSMAATQKFSQPICNECNKQEYSTVRRPVPNETELQKVRHLKLVMSLFELAFSKRKNI
jgi:hypothetical protein